MIGGGVIAGAGVGSAALGEGEDEGVGAGLRDSGTSGATGPWRSGGGCRSGCAGGRRKPPTAAAAGAIGAASARATARARGVERISVAADMAGCAE